MKAATFDSDIEALLGSASPLDRSLTLTEFADPSGRRRSARATTLRAFAEVIRSENAAAKERLPWLKLAAFGDVPTPRGSLRHDANLQAIEGVEGDYDGGAITVDQACDLLSTAGLAAVVYTTPSHTPESPRWRALCPTSKALEPAERDDLCARLNGALGGVLASESFTRSQAYFYGSTGAGSHHRVEVVDGRALDTADDLPSLGRRGVSIEPSNEADNDDWLRGDLDVERIKAALDAIPTGARDDREDYWRPIGMALHAESGGSAEGFALWDAWSQASAKYDARDQARVWKSFGRRAGPIVGLGTLYDLAKRHGWTGRPALPPSRLTFLSPGECAASPSRGYVLKGIIAPGDVGCIFGAPGAGKSLLAPHIGYAVAQGRAAFGMRAKVGGVLYVAAEDPHGMRGRVTALKMQHGDAPDFTLVDGVSDLLASDSPDMGALLEAVGVRRPTLIFLDTLAMAFPGLEENSAEGMGRVVAVARKLALSGAAVVLIHHDTKAEGSTPRGHSLFNGALDMALHVKRGDDGVVRAHLTKNRNGSCDHDLAFLISSAVLGKDEDGDDVTAALADELSGAQAKPPERLTAGESAAIQILRQMVAASDGEAIPDKLWRATCDDARAVSASDQADSRRRAMDRAFSGLVRKGRIVARYGLISVTGCDTTIDDFEDMS